MIPLGPFVVAFKSLGGWLFANLLDPRFWAVAALVASAGYIKGCSDRAEKAESFEREVSRLGEAAKARVRYVVVQQKVIDQEVVSALQREKAHLARDNAALLDSLSKHASRSIVPPVAEDAGGDQADDPVACFDRGGLNEAFTGILHRHAERLTAIALETENTALALRKCVERAEKLEALMGSAVEEGTTRR